jgi:hypothetical protein
MSKLKDAHTQVVRNFCYRQISEIIFKHAHGDSSELHKNFHAMVKHLYNFIEKQGLKNPLTGQPAINFIIMHRNISSA